MKILLVGDTHGDIGHCRLVIDAAKEQGCDRIFVLGDFGYWEHTEQGVWFLHKLDLYASNLGIAVYFLDGNHDKTSLILERYSEAKDPEGFLLVRPTIHYAPRGHRWTWDGVRFIALGGAYSVDKDWRLAAEARRGKPESLWFPEEEMSNNDMDTIILNNSSRVDVMLAHDKPRGSSPDWNRKNMLLCLPNQDRLQFAVKALTPSLFFHGHLHYRYEDTLMFERGDHVKVTGLAPNREANEFPGYKPEDSWYLLDTREVATHEADNPDL